MTVLTWLMVAAALIAAANVVSSALSVCEGTRSAISMACS